MENYFYKDLVVATNSVNGVNMDQECGNMCLLHINNLIGFTWTMYNQQTLKTK